MASGGSSRFEDAYTLGAALGRGSFSEVKVCTHKKTSTKYAVKIITKQNIKEPELVKREIEILMRVQHPCVVEFKELFESPNFIYLVTELLTGGELFDRIVESGVRQQSSCIVTKFQSFSEKAAAKAMSDVLSALSYLHDHGVIHRDLKPENLLYASHASDAVLKIVDFGMSRPVDGQDMLNTVCGTPAYVAPEVFDAKPYGKSVDMWGIGVILYIMLCGFEPFADDSDERMFTRILTCDYSFPSPSWDTISKNAKDLVSRLICLDPSARLTAKEALKHAWVSGHAASSRELPETYKRLKDFHAQRKLRGGANAILAVQRFIKLAQAHRRR